MVNYMRYFLFFLFLFSVSLHSHLLFAQAPVCSGQHGSVDICGLSAGTQQMGVRVQNCLNGGEERKLISNGACTSGPHIGASKFLCVSNCTCPPPLVLNTITNASGYDVTACIEQPPTETPDECEFGDVYDPVTGTVSCNDGSGNESSPPTSSAASSAQCVVPGDYNGDCIPDSEQGSSAAASTPPTSQPSGGGSSSPSENPDDPDGGENDGGGGGGSGSGSGNNTGGGSASSSGANSSWTPHAGYGGWLPVSENSPCPNKYQDNTGQWWCAAAGSGTGQNSSQGAGQCDPTSKDYLACISLNQPSNSGSSVCSPSSPDYLDCSGKLANAEGTITGLSQSFTETIDEKTEQYKTALTDDLDGFSRDGVPFKEDPGIIKSALLSLLPVSTSCNPPDLKIMGRTYPLDCKYFNIFKQAFGWFLAVLTAWQIWHMAIRPVER